MTEPAPEFDPHLWFTYGDCCPGRHYLLHAAHTVPGRMRAWCPTERVVFSLSKPAIDDCSPEARYWIMGFLAGNEPDAPRDDDGDYLPADDPRYRRWQAAIREFGRTGVWDVSGAES